MFWKFTYQGRDYASWGSPRRIPDNLTSNRTPMFIPVYSGAPIKPGESVVFLMQGDATLGMGDTIWLISFMRDIYRIKSRRRARFSFYSSPDMLWFYEHFLPGSFDLRTEYMPWDKFLKIDHKLPAMLFWHEEDHSDKSWVDNRSLLERLYVWTGMQYDGLPDFGEFTNEQVLYPGEKYYQRLGINPKDKYIFFQWHSSGHAKNLPPKTNIKIIKHLVKKYGHKVYVIGRLKCLDVLNEIPGVINLSNKTPNGVDVVSLAFNSEFIVCPDSAGVHLAEAFRIPCVCIMATLPPVFTCSKYKIPAFIFGKGHCPYKPCGVVHKLPREKCPEDTGDYCKVLDDVDLVAFDRALEKSYGNRLAYRSAVAEDFYDAYVPENVLEIRKPPITLNPPVKTPSFELNN